MSGIASTIAPKSDQLNAEDFLTGPRTVRVREVRITGGKDQPVSVFYDDDSAKPWKPCKTMRRLMVYAWGKEEATYAGRLLTLYRDERVKWANEEVGGIRISAMSHIGNRPIKVSLTVTKGIRAPYEVQPLRDDQAGDAGGAGGAGPMQTGRSRTEQQAEQPWIILVSKQLSTLRNDEWLNALRAACQICPTAGDLAILSALPSVKGSLKNAPGEVRSEIMNLLNAASGRLAPVDTGIGDGDGFPGDMPNA